LGIGQAKKIAYALQGVKLTCEQFCEFGWCGKGHCIPSVKGGDGFVCKCRKSAKYPNEKAVMDLAFRRLIEINQHLTNQPLDQNFANFNATC